MALGTFGRYKHIYHEQGYIPVPAKNGTKATNLPTKEQDPTKIHSALTLENSGWLLDSEQYDNDQIAIATSNLVCVDVDVLQENIWQAILAELMMYYPTPLVVRGRKGFAAFYNSTTSKFGLKFAGQENKKEKDGLDILSKGSYKLMPPSIHPEGKVKFEFLFDPVEQTPRTALPKITDKDLESIKNLVIRSYADNTGLGLSFTPEQTFQKGRNDTLKACVGGKYGALKTKEEIILELMDYDRRKFGASALFDDPGQPGGTRRGRAERFVNGIITSIENQRRNREIKPVEELNLESFNAFATYEKLPLPELPCLITKTVEYLNVVSKAQNNMGIATALSLGATLISLKYYLEDDGQKTMPNIYTMCVALSGSGKNAGKSLIKKVIEHFKDKEQATPDQMFLNSLTGSPKTDVGLFAQLVYNRSTLALIDEAERFFANAQNKNGHGQGVVPLINELYSSSESFYSRDLTYKMIAAKEATAVKQPHYSMMGWIQPEQFLEGLSPQLISNGFLPRTLVFFHEGIEISVKNRRDELSKLVFREIIEILRPIVNKPYEIDQASREKELQFAQKEVPKNRVEKEEWTRERDQLTASRMFKPTPIKLSQEAKDLMAKIDLEIQTDATTKGDEAYFSMVVRILENASKIALIHHCTLKRNSWERPENTEISVETMRYAIDLAKSISLPIISFLSKDMGQDKALVRVKKYIEKHRDRLRDKEMTFARMLNKLRLNGLEVQKRRNLVATLSDDQVLKVVSSDPIRVIIL